MNQKIQPTEPTEVKTQNEVEFSQCSKCFEVESVLVDNPDLTETSGDYRPMSSLASLICDQTHTRRDTHTLGPTLHKTLLRQKCLESLLSLKSGIGAKLSHVNFPSLNSEVGTSRALSAARLQTRSAPLLETDTEGGGSTRGSTDSDSESIVESSVRTVTLTRQTEAVLTHRQTRNCSGVML